MIRLMMFSWLRPLLIVVVAVAAPTLYWTNLQQYKPPSSPLL